MVYRLALTIETGELRRSATFTCLQATFQERLSQFVFAVM